MWRRSAQPNWRAVPKVNLLGGGGRRHSRVLPITLALLLLVGVYLLYSGYLDGSSLREERERANSRLKAAQITLASRRDEVSRLEAELNVLLERSRASETLDQQLGSERWQEALKALEEIQGDGVSFQSFQGNANGELTVVAVAVGEQPLAQLQRRLLETDRPYEVQSVQWKQDEGALIFTATLLVRGSP